METALNTSISLQAHGWHHHEGEVHHLTFPFMEDTEGKGKVIQKLILLHIH